MISAYFPSDFIDKLVRSGSITQKQGRRLGVVEAYFYQGQGRSQTSRSVGVSLPFVDRWRQRWQASLPLQKAWFAQRDHQGEWTKADADFIWSILADAARSGAPAKFDQATRNRVIAIALEKPSDHGIPIERWSRQILADYLSEGDLVESISSSTVSNFLKSASRTTAS